MPFDADEAAKKLGLDPHIQSAGSPGSIDADKLAQSLGLQTLPNKGQIQNGSTAAKSFVQKAAEGLNTAMNPIGAMLNDKIQSEAQTPGAANAAATHLGQGATVGLADEGAAAVGAAFPTQTDKELGRSYTDRYASIRDNLRQNIKDTAKTHPAISAITELLGGGPLAFVTAGATQAAGLGNLATAGVNAAASGLYGLGKSDKETVAQAALDTAIPAATSLGLSALGNAKGLTKFVSDKYKSFVNQGTEQEVIDKLNPANVGIQVSPRPNGDFDIKFGSHGDKAALAVKIGKDEGRSLAHPDVQAKITDEVNGIFGTEERPGVIPQLIKETKASIGQIRDPLLKQIGATPTDAQTPLDKLWDKVKTFDTGGDSEKEKALEHFKGLLTTAESRLRATSPTSALNDVPLSTTFAQTQDMGTKIWEQGLYKKAPEVRRMAQDLYFSLKKAGDAADTSGQMKTLSDVFHTLYRMDENSISSPDKLEALTNPTAKAARNAYQDFIKPMLDLDPNIRASMTPKLQEYLATQFPTTLNKAAVVKAVTSKADAKGIIGWTLNKLYLNGGSALTGLSALGAAQSAAPQIAPQIASGLAPIARTAAASPALNNLISQPMQNSSALTTLK